MLGVVNMLVFRDGKVRGEKTDWIGFSWLIERAFGSIAGASVAQIGTSGAGGATALAQLGAGEVVLFDPEAARAQRLSHSLSLYRADDVGAAIAHCAGVVNATPVGMVKLPGMPFDSALMRSDQWLADIIYFPLETELLVAAKAQGQRVANSVSMVVGHAVEAFRHITGIAPDRERMLAYLLADIAGEQAA